MILGIYGTGGTGREVFDIIASAESLRECWPELIFIDDITDVQSLGDTPVMSFDHARSLYGPDEIKFVIAVGEPSLRETLYKRVCEAGYRLATIVHPFAYVFPSAKLGDGVFVKMQSIISAGAVLADNVFVQANAIVGHDVSVGAHTLISAFSHIAGNAKIGTNCYLGVRATVREQCQIGDEVVVGMGAVVMEKRVPSRVLCAGNPAKYIRRKQASKVFSD